MSNLRNITGLLMNMWQMDIKGPSVTFSLDHIDEQTKAIEIKLTGRLKDEQIWCAHRINIDWLDFSRFANHDESFVTERLINHLLSHMMQEKHKLEKEAKKK